MVLKNGLLDLTGKRAVVTGGASGIGLAIAQRFAQQGATVVCLDLDEAKSAEAARSLPNRSDALGVGCDVSCEESVRAAFRQIGGPVHILVNSAGIAHVGNLENTRVADLDRLYQVNVRGTFLCMQSALPLLLEAGGGAILNIASIAATAGLSDRLAYSMSKGAVRSLTLAVARDYLDRGIRCNCISPARVHTPFVDGFLARTYPGHEAEKMAELSRAQPIGRMGRPDEVAMLALYLCAPESAFVTGVDYSIDGGFQNLR